MQYRSTRNAGLRVSASEAIVTGLVPDGGLFVPVDIQQMDLAALKGKSYEEIALAVLQGFLPEYDADYLRQAITASYEEPFHGKAGRIVKLDDSLYSKELWHGPTCAFKDYALQLLPKLLVQGKKQVGDNAHTLILVATSGDTGTAALRGFCDVEGVSIACFYPEDGTSEIQRLQMATQEGENVHVYGVRGNFDDAQRGVKQAFSSAELREELAKRNTQLSSANSINWGRLVPQLVYYVSSYLSLWEQGCINYGDEVDFCVPTGNFGDIMAGYYAKALGLPIGKLVCASNQNNVLADFLSTGRYSTKREFYKTSSPSMDILVSSNLERLLYHESGSDEAVRGWMQSLAETGEYTVGEEVMASIRETFAAGWADEDAVSKEIADIQSTYGYLCDPHTAVAFCVARARDTANPTVVLSTASPYKFSGKVLQALGKQVPENEFDALKALEAASGTKAPQALSGLNGKQVRFTEVIDKDDIQQVPLKINDK